MGWLKVPIQQWNTSVAFRCLCLSVIFFPSPLPRIRPEPNVWCQGWLPNLIVGASRTLKFKWQLGDQRSQEINSSPFSSPHPQHKCWGLSPLAKCHHEFCGEIKFYFVSNSQKTQLMETGISYEKYLSFISRQHWTIGLGLKYSIYSLKPIAQVSKCTWYLSMNRESILYLI